MLLCQFHGLNWNAWHDKLQEPLEMCVWMSRMRTNVATCTVLVFQLRLTYLRLTTLISIFRNDIPLCFRNSFSQKQYGQYD